MTIIEEGGDCPAGCGGILKFTKVANCSCHISPPCGECVNNHLICSNSCGWEYEHPDVFGSYRNIGGGISEYVPFKKTSHYFGDGKRIFDYHYDGSSGSTMVWEGRYEGPVTEDDIFSFFGEGTFGHRGPILYPNRKFTYTKITD